MNVHQENPSPVSPPAEEIPKLGLYPIDWQASLSALLALPEILFSSDENEQITKLTESLEKVLTQELEDRSQEVIRDPITLPVFDQTQSAEEISGITNTNSLLSCLDEVMHSIASIMERSGLIQRRQGKAVPAIYGEVAHHCDRVLAITRQFQTPTFNRNLNIVLIPAPTSDSWVISSITPTTDTTEPVS